MVHCKFKTAFRFVAVLLTLGCWLAAPCHAQNLRSSSETAPVQSGLTGQNVVRLDLLAPIGANLSYNLFSDRALLLPVLISYERHLPGGRWSLGTEVLLNGGDPEERRHGVALLGRYYFRVTQWSQAPLAGFYLSPVLSYRRLRASSEYYGYSNSVVTGQGHRGGGGLLLGWQLPLDRADAPRFVFDMAVGAVGWTRLGPDSINDPAHQPYPQDPLIRRTGLMPDIRYSVGYQF